MRDGEIFIRIIADELQKMGWEPTYDNIVQYISMLDEGGLGLMIYETRKIKRCQNYTANTTTA